MTKQLFVHLLPTLVEPDELRGGIAVMIDLLRASTTIVHALAAGANSVIPCLEVADAREIAANHPRDTVVLGGERNGTLIDGFDLDNSPQRYTSEAVGGKTVVFTTTNGTRALKVASHAERVFVGAIVNGTAVVRLLAILDGSIHLICAGTDGKTTAEDILCAGRIATDLRIQCEDCEMADDSAEIAMDFFAAHSQNAETLLTAVAQSRGGRNLCALGLQADIERTVQPDLFDIVPEYFVQTGRIAHAEIENLSR